MKSFVIPAFLLALAAVPVHAARPTSDGALPRVAGPWAHLRKSPLFGSESWRLAPVWGVSLPRDVGFRIEKVYGRWLWGAPLPLRGMKAGDRAPNGWVYSRMLLPGGDTDTASPRQWAQTQLVSYYAEQTWKKLHQNPSPLVSFLDSLVLSRKTLAAFRNQDEIQRESGAIHSFQPAALLFPLFPVAHAAEEQDPGLGLTGADLKFLEEEFRAVQTEKKKEERIRIAKILKAPTVAPINDSVKAGIFGLYLLAKKFSLPELSHEEVDGNIYMRAVVRRVLEGCPKKVRDRWETRPWQILRVRGWAGATEHTKEWVQAELPGGYFTVSARAIDLAQNEAELAWLLARPLVRSAHLKYPAVSLKPWPAALETAAKERWGGILRAQSPKDAEGIDVGDELAVDESVFQCMAAAGYDPGAGLSYLKRLSVARDQDWAKWFFEHHTGFDYRLQRANELLLRGQARGKIGKAETTNPKRFRAAARLWNVVP